METLRDDYSDLNSLTIALLVSNFILILGYCFQEWNEYFYAKLKDTPINCTMESWEFWKELLGLVLTCTHLVFMVVAWAQASEPDRFETMDEAYYGWYINSSQLVGFVILIHWLRAVLIIKVSKGLTPFLQILGKLLYDILRFLSISALSLLMFCCAFALIFRQLEVYQDFAGTIE